VELVYRTNERRHHQHKPSAHNCWQRKADRLATTGRHEHENVMTCEWDMVWRNCMLRSNNASHMFAHTQTCGRPPASAARTACSCTPRNPSNPAGCTKEVMYIYVVHSTLGARMLDARASAPNTFFRTPTTALSCAMCLTAPHPSGDIHCTSYTDDQACLTLSVPSHHAAVEVVSQGVAARVKSYKNCGGSQQLLGGRCERKRTH
jgi:hypothetical protein